MSDRVSPERNKTIVRRFVEEVLNAHDLDRLEEFLAAEYVDHSADLAGRPAIEELRRGFELWYGSFPDHHIEIEQLVAESDFVASRSLCTATHVGAYCGVSATGTRVAFAAHELFAMREGKIAEHWEVWDEASVLRQLGIAPTLDSSPET